MNAAIETLPTAAARDFSATSKFKMLLKREFWENKGGLLWAPVIAGIVSIVVMIGVLVAFEVKVAPKLKESPIITDDGVRIHMNGLDLGKLASHVKPEEMRDLGGGIDMFLYSAASWPFIVVGFVIFFYCLGSLYDERRDRSVLFWRSLPVSDSATVLSKLATATIVAPTIATAVGILTLCTQLLLLSVFILYHGGSPVDLLFGAGSPLRVIMNLVASIPLYAVWMLPTVGWLMLCSAWARRLPFLWATAVPVFATLLLGWITLMGTIDSDSFVWFMKNISSRALFSVTPFSWLGEMDLNALQSADGPGDVSAHFSIGHIFGAFASLRMWVGAAAGVAMILVAIRLRRWRDEG